MAKIIDYEKVFVEVIINVTTDGKTIPKSVIWDYRTFEIDKIIKVDNTIPQHVGAGPSVRYVCLLYGKEKNLFWEEMTNKWFVEKPILYY